MKKQITTALATAGLLLGATLSSSAMAVEKQFVSAITTFPCLFFPVFLIFLIIISHYDSKHRYFIFVKRKNKKINSWIF